MRITTRTNLAVRILMCCGVNADRLVTREEIAETVNASAHHVGHVVGRLSHIGVLRTVRGRAGGLELAAPMNRINIGRIFREMEGEVPLAECFDLETNTCPLAGACLLRKALEAASRAFYAKLDEVSLADLVDGNETLAALMCPGFTTGTICRNATRH